MRIAYRLWEEKIFPCVEGEDDSDRLSAVIEEGEEFSVKDLLRRLVSTYGFPSRKDADIASFAFWETVYPCEDRDFFERGIQKFYTLVLFSPQDKSRPWFTPDAAQRRRVRLNRMIAKLAG